MTKREESSDAGFKSGGFLHEASSSEFAFVLDKLPPEVKIVVIQAVDEFKELVRTFYETNPNPSDIMPEAASEWEDKIYKGFSKLTHMIAVPYELSEEDYADTDRYQTDAAGYVMTEVWGGDVASASSKYNAIMETLREIVEDAFDDSSDPFAGMNVRRILESEGRRDDGVYIDGRLLGQEGEEVLFSLLTKEKRTLQEATSLIPYAEFSYNFARVSEGNLAIFIDAEDPQHACWLFDPSNGSPLFIKMTTHMPDIISRLKPIVTKNIQENKDNLSDDILQEAIDSLARGV